MNNKATCYIPAVDALLLVMMHEAEIMQFDFQRQYQVELARLSAHTRSTWQLSKQHRSNCWKVMT